jgi:hypothetical protein
MIFSGGPVGPVSLHPNCKITWRLQDELGAHFNSSALISREIFRFRRRNLQYQCRTALNVEPFLDRQIDAAYRHEVHELLARPLKTRLT